MQEIAENSEIFGDSNMHDYSFAGLFLFGSFILLFILSGVSMNLFFSDYMFGVIGGFASIAVAMTLVVTSFIYFDEGNQERHKTRDIIAENVAENYGVDIETDIRSNLDTTDILHGSVVPVKFHLDDAYYQDTYAIRYDKDSDSIDIVLTDKGTGHAPRPEEIKELATS